MFIKSYFLLIVFLLVTACGLQQPDESVVELYLGPVFVNSNINDAEIFIDYNSTGQMTPDSIQKVPIGEHILHVFKDGFTSIPDSVIIYMKYLGNASASFMLQPITDPATLFIDSNPQGAAIWVNKKFSGKSTPGFLSVNAGIKEISLKKNDFENYNFDPVNISAHDTVNLNVVLSAQPQVLIESFANSSCLPCTTTNAHLETFMSTYDENDYALIEYFTSWPNPQDPMYLHNPEGSSTRFDRSFYYVTSVPAMFINGSVVDATEYNSIQSMYTSQLASLSKDISISISRQLSDSLRVTAELNELNPIPSGNWRLFIAVVEKQLSFASPPGSNGLSTFSHVFRKFVTTNEGDTFNLTNNAFKKLYSTSISAEWNLDEIQIIGFIQNIDTKEVISTSHL